METEIMLMILLGIPPRMAEIIIAGGKIRQFHIAKMEKAAKRTGLRLSVSDRTDLSSALLASALLGSRTDPKERAAVHKIVDAIFDVFEKIDRSVPAGLRCNKCQKPQHDVCSMTPGCPCCDNTIARGNEDAPISQPEHHENPVRDATDEQVHKIVDAIFDVFEKTMNAKFRH